MTLAAFNLKAQDADTTCQMVISGIITEAKTKEAIPFAAIGAYNMNDSLVNAAQADMDGAYTLKIGLKTTDSIYLKVRYWSYEDITAGPMRVNPLSLRKDFEMKLSKTAYDSVIIISCPIRLMDTSIPDLTDTMIIRGVVTDKITKEAIPFATVAAYNLKNETIAGATVNLDGEYSLKISCKAARYITVKANYPGYRVQSTGKLAVAPFLRKLDFKMGASEGVNLTNCTIEHCCGPMVDSFGNFRPMSGEEYRRRP